MTYLNYLWLAKLILSRLNIKCSTDVIVALSWFKLFYLMPCALWLNCSGLYHLLIHPSMSLDCEIEQSTSWLNKYYIFLSDGMYLPSWWYQFSSSHLRFFWLIWLLFFDAISQKALWKIQVLNMLTKLHLLICCAYGIPTPLIRIGKFNHITA